MKILNISAKHIMPAVCSMLMIIGWVFTARSEEYKVMEFDENGRLVFEMLDNPAVHTAYKTVGWTIKKYDLPINHPDNLTITVVLEDESYKGEDGYIHTTVYVRRDTILDKVQELSSDWLDEIRRFGGTAYLDNIMTVCEGGVMQGSLRDDGSFEGEVYNTYNGISQARGWRNPEDLKQYFGRRIAIPADKQEYSVTPQEKSNVTLKAYYNCVPDAQYTQLSIGRYGRLYSREYDCQQAIPVLEGINADGSFSAYGYEMNYRKVTGTIYYGINVTVGVTLKWKDSYGDEFTDDIEYSQWYEIARTYSYYEVDTINFYQLAQWRTDNAAIGSFTIQNTELSCIEHTQYASVNEPEYSSNIYYDAGIIDGGSRRPSVPDYDLEWLASQEIGEIITTSDCITIDGRSIIDAYGIHMPKEERRIILEKDNLVIAADTKNITYPTESTCVYTLEQVAGIRSAAPKHQNFNVLVNPITIHTPVVCSPAITDNRADNQRVQPDEERISMILGKKFNVYVEHEGVHIGNKGYQRRNYSKYVYDNEISFPFEVLRGQVTYPPGSWISIGRQCEDNSFELPVTVGEGEYTVSIRTIAVNAAEGDKAGDDIRKTAQLYANTASEYYMACNYCDVYVSGQITDFTITSGNDPAWNGIWGQSGIKAAQLILNTPLLRLGYDITWELTTTGSMDENDYVSAIPHFYYIPGNNDNRYDSGGNASDIMPKEVDLYEIASDGAGGVAIRWLGEELGRDEIVCTGESDNGHIKRWQCIYRLPKTTVAVEKGLDLTQYVYEHMADGRTPIWENYVIKPLQAVQSGMLLVNYDIRTVVDGKEYLSYANQENAKRGYCNMWQQEGVRPVMDKAVNPKAPGQVYNYGDIVWYYAGRNYMEDYQIVGTH